MFLLKFRKLLIMHYLKYQQIFWMLLILSRKIRCKYVEGTLRTSENWAFLARFCFLSDEGEFEYFIEFNENQGDPNLLLYYDTADQWPAVYKSSKTCEEREAMLNIQQNQIVNLTARLPFHREHSGCQFQPLPPTTPRPRFTLSIPTVKPKKRTTKHSVIKLTPTKSATTKMTTTILTTMLPTISSSEASTQTGDFSTLSPLESLDLLESTTSGVTTQDGRSTSSEDTTFLSTTENINTDYETIGYNMIITTTEAPTEEFKKPPIKKRSLAPNKSPPFDSQKLGRIVTCHHERRFKSSRERWWFIAISNCNGTKECKPEAQKQMLLKQLKKDKSRKYSPELRCFALTLNFHSSSAYEYVRSIFGKHYLLHQRTLSKWYSSIDGSPGYSAEALRAVKIKVKSEKEKGKNLYAGLVMDEMSIREHIQWTGSRHVGYVNFGTRMNDSDSLPKAKNALVFMLVGYNCRWKVPVAYFLVELLTAEEKANIVKGCLLQLDSTGIIIKSLMFDGCSTNLAMCSLLGANLQFPNITPFFANPVNDILPVLMAFSIAYSFLMLGIVVCSLELKSRQLLHTTYKIFVLSVVTQLFGILIQSMVYLKYAVSGLESPKVKRTGAVFMGASETCFLLLLLLLAKGFTITRGRLPIGASVKLTVFMCFYVMMYISLFVYEAEVFDPGQVLYLYESPAGYGLIVLRIVAWIMFVYSTVFTLKHYPEKTNFYYPFNIFGTIWFVAGPAFILSANTYIDKWVRESVVYAVLLFIAFGGHLMFLILTMPSVANKNFPYHVRTTQIGVMEVAGNAGNSTIEQFGHHVYEPTSALREQTVIIPLTRRTEEIFEGMYNQRAFGRNNDSPKNDVASKDSLYTIKDVTMENVLKWSTAKKLPPLELPNFERANKNRSSIGSANSVISGNTLVDNPNISRRQSLTNQLNLESQNASLVNNNVNGTSSTFQDYVKDVPIELFTVSKMVITATKDLHKSRATIQEIDQPSST